MAVDAAANIVLIRLDLVKFLTVLLEISNQGNTFAVR